MEHTKDYTLTVRQVLQNLGTLGGAYETVSRGVSPTGNYYFSVNAADAAATIKASQLLISQSPCWIPVEERLPVIDPLGVTATVIVAHAEYDANREPTGNVAVSPASYVGTDQQGPFFKSMITGRRLVSRAWMPLPEPPEAK